MVVVASLLLRWADPAPPDGSDSELKLGQLPGRSVAHCHLGRGAGALAPARETED